MKARVSLSLVSLLVLPLILCLISQKGSLLPDYAPDLRKVALPPLHEELFGRDQLGRPLGWLLVSGVLHSLALAVPVSLAAAFAALAASRLALKDDSLGYRLAYMFSNFLFAFPPLVTMILIGAFLPGQKIGYAALLVLFFGAANFRIFCSEIFVLKKSGFLMQARCLNVSQADVFRVHLVPMLKSICLVRVLITVAEVVILENSIGFLGLSAGTGAVSLGELLANGWHNFFLAPWILLESSLALFGLLFLLFWKARTIQENWQKTCFLE